MASLSLEVAKADPYSREEPKEETAQQLGEGMMSKEAIALIFGNNGESLNIQPVTAKDVGAKEVLIVVTVGSLSASDLQNSQMSTLRAVIGYVKSWGDGVATFKAGQEVVALVDGPLSSEVIAQADFVAPLPSNFQSDSILILAEAVMARYLLSTKKNLKPNEELLVLGNPSLPLLTQLEQAGREARVKISQAQGSRGISHAFDRVVLANDNNVTGFHLMSLLKESGWVLSLGCTALLHLASFPLNVQEINFSKLLQTRDRTLVALFADSTEDLVGDEDLVSSLNVVPLTQLLKDYRKEAGRISSRTVAVAFDSLRLEG